MWHAERAEVGDTPATLGCMRGARRRSRAGAVLAGQAAAAAAEVEASLEPTPDARAAAFFDVDNTMVRGASIFHLARGLARRKFFTPRDMAKFAYQQLVFLLGGAEHADHMRDAQESALSFIAGHRVEELRSLGEEIYDEIIERKVWPGTRAIAQMHLDAGQRVWLVTATPVELATTIAKRLGFSGALGTVAESVDGVYTGRLVGEPLHGQAKAEAVRALAARERLDLAQCSAYSDSANDIPLLSLVGHPVAINPDGALERHARREGWRIRDYRRGRKAVLVGVPAAAGIGALAGGVAGGVVVYRRRHHRRALDRVARLLRR